MIKKYSVFYLICSLFVIRIFIDFETFIARNSVILFAVLGYEEMKAVDMVQMQKIEMIFPLLIPDKAEVIIAKREDSFKLTRLEPVELLTMMELENVGEELSVLPTEENNVIENIVTEDEAVEITEEEEIIPTMFVPHGLQRKINLETIADYDSLVKNFYTIDTDKVGCRPLEPMSVLLTARCF